MVDPWSVSDDGTSLLQLEELQDDDPRLDVTYSRPYIKDIPERTEVFHIVIFSLR